MSKVLKMLAVETGLSESAVQRIMLSAPRRYKVYFIDKRNGEKRKISQTAREVKLLQRALVKTLLDKLPIHSSATAYREGLSIRDNALPNIGIGPILKMDLTEFFPSIRKSDWVKYCRDSKCLEDADDIELTSCLLFQKPKNGGPIQLAIGAPSSPVLSNIIMFKFDQQIVDKVSHDKVRYTRYADDLTFSAPRTGHLTRVKETVYSVIKSLEYPRLKVNSDKTIYVTSKFHRTVTGLTIANDARITIGRAKKRQIRAAVHRASKGEMTTGELQSLAGMLAFVNSVEPGFITILRHKYGVRVVGRIQNTVRIKHGGRSTGVRA